MKLRLALVGLCLAALAGCGGGDEETGEVVLVTHDSFVVSKPVLRAFERESGLKLKILQAGDAGEALNRALLTAGNPQGDVFFGVDNNLLSRALEEGLFDAYESPELASVDERYVLDEQHRVTPVDHGEVCLNVDRGWFESRSLAPPRGFDDLVAARYRGLLVVENPATSTPGLAFMLATIARYREDSWQAWWRRLRANDVLVVDGWEEAYTARFSGASGSKGKRPIVVSYASSPPAEVIFAGKPLDEAPTAVVASTCFRQVELAGVLRGAPNEKGARKLIDFMLSPAFQRDVPLSMFVFPVREGTKLPPEFERFAVVPAKPLELPAEEIGRNRDRWIREWTEIVLR
ncbi:MAG: thiamine ABC transporter substrate-binding protein [Actinobacteria bacterium]|nr:thiamine ABC transporter substrate-binding protein [Actinomycetota bacterium]